ncbi:MAG TPA: carboxypeptidase regulatory-like domain-containing protein [Gemmatimonadaceae bacterium]|nr:carboxypeptidase regulatory-like domain-containing protein [Gemmatimonadaceae bacterium]
MLIRGVALLAVWASIAWAQGSTVGTVRENGKAVESASVHVERTDHRLARDVVTDSAGRFRVAALSPGVYTVGVRRVGYRSAEISPVRIAGGQPVSLDVELTQAPRQLSTIRVVTSPTAIDVSRPELTMRFDRAFTEQLPSARDAASLIALVPGARKDQLWGGAPGVSNNYQMDGIAANHPGTGGDFLALSVDWIDALEVRGLGAGAEYGNFQGGIINALTRTGGNVPRVSVRTSYESAGLTSSNIGADEAGVEQAGRREISGEAVGPIARDRLFYFVGGQYVDRDLRAANLATASLRDFQPTREVHTDARALGKLTWLPAIGQRVDLLAGFSSLDAARAGINGIDDPSATVRVQQPVSFYELSWSNASRPRHVFDVKLGGFVASESRLGYGSPGVPGVQLMQRGRVPVFQNSAFDERRHPSSVSGSAEWKTTQHMFRAEHELVLGTELTFGRWRDYRTRNGGMTWRPYTSGAANLNPFDASTWNAVASDWGGEMHVDTDTDAEAVFVQDYVSIGSRLTLSPGVRVSRWRGNIRPDCTGTSYRSCRGFNAVDAHGVDPRLGAVWDVSGRNTMAVKAHWGRYHQAMYSLFFDRVAGADAYSNSRFYYNGPRVTDGTRTYTTAERDAPGSPFTVFDEQILNESGRVEGYRQPFVDQTVLAFEKTFGPTLKLELGYTHRRNGNIVGLLDRNLQYNYSVVRDVSVRQRLFGGAVFGADGDSLLLPVVYVANKDLLSVLQVLALAKGPNATVGGYGTYYLTHLSWDPDLVLTTIPQARRAYDQLTATVRAYHDRWRGEGSLTTARLRGNVAGVAGHGTTGSRFSAGPFVRPNESTNAFGYLPDALQFEGKVWLTAQVTRSLQAGALFTHVLGERFTPRFELLGRYDYADANGAVLPADLFDQVLGQTVFTESRGDRRYASRDILDAHLEWRARSRVALTFDVFNVLGSAAITLLNETVGDQDANDPTSLFGAARTRAAPRSLRLGLRVD